MDASLDWANARSRRRVRNGITVPMIPPNCEEYLTLWKRFFARHEKIGRQDCKLSVLLYDSIMNRRVDENTNGFIVYGYILSTSLSP
jgi:hypothetical protein